MSEILNFWENKYNYSTVELLKDKITEFYRSDFIENYTKWKKHVDDFNQDGLHQLIEVGMPEKFWTPIQYDEFCQGIIDMITEWITVNKDINRHDIKVILEKLFTEFLGKHLKVWQDNMYTMDALLASVKRPWFDVETKKS